MSVVEAPWWVVFVMAARADKTKKPSRVPWKLNPVGMNSSPFEAVLSGHREFAVVPRLLEAFLEDVLPSTAGMKELEDVARG